jgi:hypothetical protein
MQKRRFLVTLALAALAQLALAPASRAADDPGPADWLTAPNASAERVEEPVFGGKVMLYRAGRRDGDPVVLVHGLGQDGARDWSYVIPALAPNYDV